MTLSNDPRTPESRESRLPVWAQDTINMLRLRLEEAERAAEAATLKTNPDGSTVRIVNYGAPEKLQMIGLGVRPHLEFSAEPDRPRSVIRVNQDRDLTLVISGDNLTIQPIVSNSVRIISRRRS
jgi:hypothetical protein